jgi:hypothetical protein
MCQQPRSSQSVCVIGSNVLQEKQTYESWSPYQRKNLMCATRQNTYVTPCIIDKPSQKTDLTTFSHCVFSEMLITHTSQTKEHAWTQYFGDVTNMRVFIKTDTNKIVDICEGLMRKITICKGYGFNLNTWAIQHGLTDQHKSVLRTLTEKERDAMFMCCAMMYPTQ